MTGTKDVLLRLAANVAVWLRFAATPTFALMAWISAVSSQGITMTMGSAASPLVPIDDMVLMYLLMGLFQLSPWLKLLSRRFAAPHHPINQTEGD